MAFCDLVKGHTVGHYCHEPRLEDERTQPITHGDWGLWEPLDYKYTAPPSPYTYLAKNGGFHG